MTKNLVGLFFTGVCIGIFLGLSKTPVLLQILVPLFTIIVSLLAIFTGKSNYESKNEVLKSIKNVSVFPIMWLLIGMVIGSCLGLLMKNYDVLAPSRGEINVNDKNQPKVESRTVLHNITKDECENLDLCSVKGGELLKRVIYFENPEVEYLLSKQVFSFEELENKLKSICGCEG